MDSNDDQKKRTQITEDLTASLAAALNDPVPVTPTCRISKSKYVAGMQCPKRLYLQVYRPDLGTVTDESKAVMEQGNEVGVLARDAFPGGVLVTADRDHLAQAIRQTRELIDNPEVPAIFEATFEHHGVLVRVDVLERRGLAFRLVEVKSSTDVKPYHSHDLGIQKYVAEGCGIFLNEVALMHLNRNYVYNGEVDHNGNRRYDLRRLFVVTPISPSTAACVSRVLVQQFDALRQPQLPTVAPGSQCSDPYRCEFHSVCNPPVPEWDVRALPIATWKAERLRERGILTVDDLPDGFSLRFVYHLTPKECLAAMAAKRRVLHVRSGLSLAVATLSFPLCFLDFETYWPALPWHAGMRPYEHIPFQWSLHRQEHPSAPLEHSQFLWEQSDDPRPSFTRSLCEALDGAGTIVVYNQSFESSRLNASMRSRTYWTNA